MDVENADSSTEEEEKYTYSSSGEDSDRHGLVLIEGDDSKDLDVLMTDNAEVVVEQEAWEGLERNRDAFMNVLGILVDKGYVRRPRVFVVLASICGWVQAKRKMFLSHWKILRTQMLSPSLLYDRLEPAIRLPAFTSITTLDMVLTTDDMGLLVCDVIEGCGQVLSDIYVRCANSRCPFHNMMPGTYSSHRYTHAPVTDRRVLNAIVQKCCSLRSLAINLHIFPMELAAKISRLTTLTCLTIKANYICYPISGNFGNLGFFEAMFSSLVNLKKVTLGSGVWDMGVFKELWTKTLTEIHLGNTTYHGPNDVSVERINSGHRPDATESGDINLGDVGKPADNGEDSDGSCSDVSSGERCAREIMNPGFSDASDHGTHDSPRGSTQRGRTKSKTSVRGGKKKSVTEGCKNMGGVNKNEDNGENFARFVEHSAGRNPISWIQDWEKFPSSNMRLTPSVTCASDTQPSHEPGVERPQKPHIGYTPAKCRERDLIMSRFKVESARPQIMENIVSVSFCVVDLANAPLFFLPDMPNVRKVCIYVASNDLGAPGPDICPNSAELAGKSKVEDLSVVYGGPYTKYLDQITRLRSLCDLVKVFLKRLSLSGLNNIDSFAFGGIFAICPLLTSLSLDNCHFDYMQQRRKGGSDGAAVHQQEPKLIPEILSLRLGVFSSTDLYLKDFINFVQRFPNVREITLTDRFVLLITNLSKPFRTEVVSEDGSLTMVEFKKIYVRPGMVDEEKSAFLQYCRSYFLRLLTSKKNVKISFDTFHSANSLFIS